MIMKKITTVMASAMLMGAAMTAGATNPPAVPSIYSAGPFKSAYICCARSVCARKSGFRLIGKRHASG